MRFNFELYTDGFLRLVWIDKDGNEVEKLLNDRDTTRLFIELLGHQDIVLLRKLPQMARDGGLSI